MRAISPLLVAVGVVAGEAAKQVHIKPVKLKLHGNTQDGDGEDEMSIGMYAEGCGRTGQCYECQTHYSSENGEQSMCDAFVNVHYSKSDCCALLKVVDTLRKTNNVKAFWPYYNLAPLQKVQANADREISGGACAKPIRKGTEAYLMLQEQDIWVNDASSTSTISPARVNSWYSLFESMETSTADKKVTKFELSYTFGFKELNVMTLLQQQIPEAAFLAGLALDELCVSSVDLALMAGGPVVRKVGKTVAKAAYKKGATKAAARAEAFTDALDSAAQSELGSEGLNRIGNFLDQTEFCVVDLIGEGGDAKYEITYEITYEEESACTVSAAHDVASLIPWILMLLAFRGLQ